MKSKRDGDRGHLDGLRERFVLRNADRCPSIVPVAFVFLCEIWARYLFKTKREMAGQGPARRAGFRKKPLRGVRGTWKDALDSVEGSAGVMGFSFTAAPMCVAVMSSPGMIGGLDLEEKYGQSHPHRMMTVWRRLHLRTKNTV